MHRNKSKYLIINREKQHSPNKNASLLLPQLKPLVINQQFFYYQVNCEKQFQRANDLINMKDRQSKEQAYQILNDLFFNKMMMYPTDQQTYSLKQSIALTLWRMLDDLNRKPQEVLKMLRIAYVYLLDAYRRIIPQKNNLSILIMLLSKQQFAAGSYSQALKMSNEALTYCNKNDGFNEGRLKIHQLKCKIYRKLKDDDKQLDEINLCMLFARKLKNNQTKYFSEGFFKNLQNRKLELQSLKYASDKFGFDSSLHDKPFQFSINKRSNSLTTDKHVPRISIKKKISVQNIKHKSPNKKQIDNNQSFIKIKQFKLLKPKLRLKIIQKLPMKIPEKLQITSEQLIINKQKMDQFHYMNYFISRPCNINKQKIESIADISSQRQQQNTENKQVIKQIPVNLQQQSRNIENQNKKLLAQMLKKCSQEVQKVVLNNYVLLVNQNKNKSVEYLLFQNSKSQFAQNNQNRSQLTILSQEIKSSNNNKIDKQLNFTQRTIINSFINFEFGILNKGTISISKIQPYNILPKDQQKKLVLTQIQYINKILIVLKFSQQGIYKFIIEQKTNQLQFNCQQILNNIYPLQNILISYQDSLSIQIIQILKLYLHKQKKITGSCLYLTKKPQKLQMRYFQSKKQNNYMYRENIPTIDFLYSYENKKNYILKNQPTKFQSNQILYIYFTNSQIAAKTILLQNTFKPHYNFKKIINKQKHIFQKLQKDSINSIYFNIYYQKFDNLEFRQSKTNSFQLNNNQLVKSNKNISLIFTNLSHIKRLFYQKKIQFFFLLQKQVYFCQVYCYQTKSNCLQEYDIFYKFIIRNAHKKNSQHTLILNANDINQIQIGTLKDINLNFNNTDTIFKSLLCLAQQFSLLRSFLYQKMTINIPQAKIYLSNKFFNSNKCFKKFNNLLSQQNNNIKIIYQKIYKIKQHKKNLYSLLTIYNIVKTKMVNLRLFITTICRNYSLIIPTTISQYLSANQLQSILGFANLSEQNLQKLRQVLYFHLFNENEFQKITWVKLINLIQFEVKQTNLYQYCIVKIGKFRGIIKESSIFQCVSVGQTKIYFEVSINQQLNKNKQRQAIKVNQTRNITFKDKYFKHLSNIFEESTKQYLIYLNLNNSDTYQKITYSYYLSDIKKLMIQNNHSKLTSQNKQENLFYQESFRHSDILKLLNIFKQKTIRVLIQYKFSDMLFRDQQTKGNFNLLLRQKLGMQSTSNKITLNYSKLMTNNSQRLNSLNLIHKSIIKYNCISSIFYDQYNKELRFYIFNLEANSLAQFKIKLQISSFPYANILQADSFQEINHRVSNYYHNKISVEKQKKYG